MGLKALDDIIHRDLIILQKSSQQYLMTEISS